MKKALFSFLSFTLLTIVSDAQISKGSLFMGGNVRLFTNKVENPGVPNSPSTQQTGFNLAPVYGKATRENFVWGVEAGISISGSKNDETDFKQNGSSFDLGVFVRKYKNIGKSGFYIFIQGKLAGNYYKNTQKLTTNNYETVFDSKEIGVYINPGISYAISRKFHLESGFNNLAYLTYGNTRIKDNGTITRRTCGVDLGANLSNMASVFYLGFRVLIDRSKS